MRVYLRFLTALLLMCCMSGLSYAETLKDLRVTGTVTADGEPMPGVSVLLKGTTTGTITDLNGKYSLQATSNGTLVFSFVGMKTVEQPINNRQVVNAALVSDSKELEEVMVVAYATAKKYSFTGAASTVKGDDIAKLQTSSISKALEGSVAGLQASASSGQPGTDAEIRIRGVGSINASSSPLYVVDGVPYDGSINAINPDDIASMTVLKDAASAALYGSRGANGVIIITTKQGKSDSKATVSVKATFGGSQRAIREYDKLGTNDHFELYWEALRNGYAKDKKTYPTLADANAAASKNLVGALMGGGRNPYGTKYPQPVGTDGKLVAGATPLWDADWSKALEQQALRSEVGLNVSGGGATNQYYFSAGYLDDKGIVLESSYQRFNLRSNITSQMTSWLKGGANISFTHSIQNYPQSSDSSSGNVIMGSLLMAPFYPIYEVNEDGSYVYKNGQLVPDFGSYRQSGSMSDWNLVATMPEDKAERMKDEVSARTFLEVTFIKGLKFKTSFNFDLVNFNSLDFQNSNIGDGAIYGGETARENDRTFSWTWNNILTYDKTIGDHHFNILAGQEAYSYRYDELTASRSKMALPDFPELAVGSQITGANGYRIDYSLVGYLVSGQYDFKNKYFLSASFRRDGSSRFAPESRWGNFWSVGGSWRIDREKFMQSTEDWLSALTLKASYGAQGNDNLGTYYASSGLFAVVSNNNENGLVSNRLATPNLKWETNLNFNVGLDFSFLKNRLSGSIDFFQRKSKDLLYSRPLASSLGYSSVDENVGALKNTGIEIDLKGVIIDTKDFKWRLGMNLTHYKNVITELPLKDMPAGSFTKLEEGRSIYDFYLKEWAGINPENGNPMWYMNKDGEKVATETYNSADYYYTGKSSLPTVYGGFNTSFTYKGFELSAMFSYSLGGYVYNRDKNFLLSYGSATGRAWSTDMLDRWTPENRDTDVPILTTSSSNSWTSTSTRFLVNNNYLRLKNLQLSYTFPQSMVRRISLGSLQLFVQGDNLLTFNKNQGLDPEQGINGVTYYRYPAMRSFTGGINVSF